MQRVQSNAIGVGAGRLCEGYAECFVSPVGDPNPIDSAQYDGIARTNEHNASATKGQFIEPADRLIGHRGVYWGRGIDIKACESERGFRIGCYLCVTIWIPCDDDVNDGAPESGVYDGGV